MRSLTSRETFYIGGKCHYRNDAGDSPCWSPATHRVQNGSGGGAGGCWWFVCFDHIEHVVRDPSDGHKAHVSKLAVSPGQAAAAQLICRIGVYARSVLRWGEGRCPRCGGALVEDPLPLIGRAAPGHLCCATCRRRYPSVGGRGRVDVLRYAARLEETPPTRRSPMTALQDLSTLSQALTCYKCGIAFAVPRHYATRLRESGESFWCPNGHSQAYCTARRTAPPPSTSSRNS